MNRIARNQLVSMPRLDCETAVGLCGALIRAGGKEKRLTKKLSASLAEVKRAGDDLAREVERQRDLKAKARGEQMRARREVKMSWSALHHYLISWILVPADDLIEEKEGALRAKHALFEEIRMHPHASHQQAWETIEERMSVIFAQDLQQVFRKLKAERFLEAAHRAQLAYGAALGLSSAHGPAPRELLTAFVGAVRRYVEAATDRAEKTPSMKEASLRLLAPLAEMQQIQMRTDAQEVMVELESDSLSGSG